MKIMIKYKITVMIFLAYSNIYAQEIIPLEQKGSHDYNNPEKVYYKDVNHVFDKFLGTWRYETSDESFEITFEKVEKDDRGSYFKDFLITKFKYLINGRVIFDTTSPIQPTDAGYYIFGGMITTSNLNKVRLLYNEPAIDENLDFDGRLYLTYSPRTQKLDWKVSSRSIPDPLNPEVRISPFKIPVRMTLTRVN